MSSSTLFRIVFLVYCLEAGTIFLATPWLAVWERLALALPWSPLRPLLASSWTRGAVSGFGLVHFAWLLHDAELLLRRRVGPALASAKTVGRH